MKNDIRTYTELIQLPTFRERYEYLKLSGGVGQSTFGYDRYLNQMFYRSKQWKRIRDEIIIRDCGCDLASEGRDIYGKIIIHHMNPLTKFDIEHESDYLLNPEFLICTTHQTHNAIHYGDANQLVDLPKARSENDQCPWRK